MPLPRVVSRFVASISIVALVVAMPSWAQRAGKGLSRTLDDR
jgi:hypothetical protein